MLIDWQMWGVQVFTILCMVMGYTAVHSALWEVATIRENTDLENQQRTLQNSAFVFDFICLFALAYSLHEDPMSRRLYLNMLLIFATTQFYDKNMPFIARSWRFVMMASIIMVSVFRFGLPIWAGLATILVVFGHAMIFQHYDFWLEKAGKPFLFVIATNLTTGMLYWLNLPYVDVHNRILEVVVYSLGMLFSYLLWVGSRRTLQRTEKLRQEADYDVLTSVRSYSRFHEDIDELVRQHQSAGLPLAMVMLDIDHFKAINDNYGHLSGNAVLIQVSTLLKQELDNSGIRYLIYRTGGEEFNIVFPGNDVDHVLPITKELWRRIRTESFNVGDQEIKTTVSVGLTGCSMEGGADQLFRQADQNLYRSKRNGRDTITVEGKTLQLNDQQAAMFTYSYFAQPIMDLKTGKQVRSELLLRMYDDMVGRWRLPQDFNVSPTTQVTLLQRTLRQLDVKAVNINLLPSQFINRRTAVILGMFAVQTKLERVLSVELTDLPDIKDMKELSALYHRYGLRIVIDDVGSDNSYMESREHLKYVDGIKFAMQNLRRDHEDDALKAKIAFWQQLADQYGLDTVLEGVENEADEKLGQELGVDAAQGYYYGRPELPKAKIKEENM